MIKKLFIVFSVIILFTFNSGVSAMTWYTTMAVDDSSLILKRFEKRYPSIKTKLFRAGGTKLFSRVFIEKKMKKTLFDVISTGSPKLYILLDRGIIEKYQSPERKWYNPGLKDKEGFWTGIYSGTNVITYNTKLVKEHNIPKSYIDLLHPMWRGKLAIDKKDGQWYWAMLKIMGKDSGRKYFKRLASQNLDIRRGHNILTELCIAGEFPVVVNNYATNTEKFMRLGAPVDWVPVEPVLMHYVGIAMAKNAKNPKSAKLFIDFILSEEGQSIIRSRARIPCRTGIMPNPKRLTDGIEFYFYSPKEWAERYDQYQKEFADILKGGT